MVGRSSYVDSLKIITALFSSVIQLGDSCYIQGFTRALAVQRQEELFFGNEGNFAEFPIFSEPIPIQPITYNLAMQTFNPPPSIIKVNTIHVTGVSASSLIHVGNSKVIQMEARVKHIRQLLNGGGSGNTEISRVPL